MHNIKPDLNTNPPSTPTMEDANLKNIILLKSNPARTTKLNLDREHTKILQVMQDHKNKFSIRSEEHIGAGDIIKTAKLKPWCLHFVGHGKNGNPTDEGGLWVFSEDKRSKVLLDATILSKMFGALKRNVSSLKLVVLNACYTEPQAKIISKHGLYVVGVSNAISDNITQAFSDVFYDTLATGDSNDFKKAVDLGRTNAFVEGLMDEEEISLFFNGEKIAI